MMLVLAETDGDPSSEKLRVCVACSALDIGNVFVAWYALDIGNVFVAWYALDICNVFVVWYQVWYALDIGNISPPFTGSPYTSLVDVKAWPNNRIHNS